MAHLAVLSSPSPLATEMDLLWLLPLLPLFGAAICGALYLVTLRQRARLAPSQAAHGHPADGHGGSAGGHGGSADGHGDGGAPEDSHQGPGRYAGFVACGAVAGTLVVALFGFAQLMGLDAHDRLLESGTWKWIQAGDVTIDVAMRLDPLSSILALVISGVGLLIHVYSTGYMKKDPGYAKYFAFLNLFVAAMFVLVLSSNLIGLFVGWEGVGLCSYLLIGFWYKQGWPAEAGQKAFVVNRIGDACFLVGSFILVSLIGTLDLAEIGAAVQGLLSDETARGKLVAAALLLFGGACGKSAQLPLFTWLPDAMAGPTPVSALIHAATMVTAGIYLVVRLNPLFAFSETVLLTIGIVGAATAFVGATSALVQRDIKKVLAYSTVSQLGFMFLALSVGAWYSAVFHLVTHAFFKGLLFLGAGSVIHGMHHEQDMHKMGGLRKHMPTTFKTFVAGSAALAGLPLMSGYFSKDEILAYTFGMGSEFNSVWLVLWGVGVVTAMLTAFYTWRMVALTFFGTERFDVAKVHPHESPKSMTLPLIALAVASVFGGLLGIPGLIAGMHGIKNWLHPILEGGEALFERTFSRMPGVDHGAEAVLLLVGAAIGVVFSLIGFRRFAAGPQPDQRFREGRPGLFGFLANAWRIDRAYHDGIVQPIKLLAFLVYEIVDQFVIDGAVNGCAALARGAAGRVRKMSDGSLKGYALWMGAGAVLLAFLGLILKHG